MSDFSLRDEASLIIGFRLPEDSLQWESILKDFSTSGTIDNNKKFNLTIMLMMRVNELEKKYESSRVGEKAPKPESTDDITLKNTTDINFHTTYLDDKNTAHEVYLKPEEVRTFPAHIGRIVRNHLAMHILNNGNFNYRTDTKLELERIKEEITIT